VVSLTRITQAGRKASTLLIRWRYENPRQEDVATVIEYLEHPSGGEAGAIL
jgi:hypothetical protein